MDKSKSRKLPKKISLPEETKKLGHVSNPPEPKKIILRDYARRLGHVELSLTGERWT